MRAVVGRLGGLVATHETFVICSLTIALLFTGCWVASNWCVICHRWAPTSRVGFYNGITRCNDAWAYHDRCLTDSTLSETQQKSAAAVRSMLRSPMRVW